MPILSSPKLFLLLASGRYSTHNGFDRAATRSKFVLRTLLTLPWSLAWLHTLAGCPQLRESLHLTPRLASKLHRPYLARHLSLGERLQRLRQHYQLMPQCFSPQDYAALRRGQALQLAQIEGKQGERYRLLLSQRHQFDKEGELSLRLEDAANIPLAIATFLLGGDGEHRRLILGGLQGPRRQHSHECIKHATKACHGLFPKRILLEALQALAHHCRARQLQAVSKQAHIYSALRYRKHFSADYDEVWQSVGGQRHGAWYLLSLPLPRKQHDEIPSKKRAEYQRRYALLDDIAAQIAANLGAAQGLFAAAATR